MTFIDDDRPKPQATARPGESLADLSLHELKTRIDLYRSEIERLNREIEAKETSRKAAESVFRL